ncbi:transglycosylase domain-containing protein [Streptomyces sp. 549]|uniref:transglycosylase domain-containing protein n=1 Tax=Streptomyces sp. 549 TaxID=3049076 RepID=UPI0024C23742|nr:transglycosylase domain-containing protein [Streptomyces sp. 549]MDK1475503.1 transglycosylase domain-containing protein [Streptomyces sp. 549]
MANKRSGGGLSATQQAAKFLGVSVLSGAVLAGIALPAVGMAGLAAKETAQGFEHIPTDLKRPPLSQKTRILDAEGGLIADVYSRNRTVVPLDEMSPWVRKAIVAIEDARFYEHGAIDLKGVLRAANRNAQEGEVAEGASTLTQQYVKNVFVEEAGDDPDKVAQATQQTIGRKIKELKYAIQLEQELSKKKILENYLNITFFGQQTYGVEAASQRYFSKPAKDLEVEEAALLAGIVQSPSRYDPVNDEQEATKRRNTVLQRMASNGDLTAKQAAAAKKKPLGLKVSRPQNGCITARMDAGFFCDYVRQEFLRNEAFGRTDKERAARWRQGGLTIKTTLSPKAQKAAASAASSKVNKSDKIAASVVSVQPGTGKILSLAQSRPYGTEQEDNETVINLAVDNRMGGSYAGFQVGSTFKPIIAAAALEKGISPAETFSSDWKTEFDQADFRTCDNKTYGQGPYPVQNELQSEKGTWDMTSALGKSINTFSIDLLKKAGLCETATMANKMGVRSGTGKVLEARPSMGLGALESTPLFMANAYATFANRGTYCTPIAIESVKDAEGKKINPPNSKCGRVMSERTADTVNQILKGVVEDGTGTRAGLTGRDNAGKTGTTERRRDAWFVGYTPDLSTAVWTGSDGANKIDMFNITIGGQYYDKVCGGCLPGPIWRSAMTGALEGVDATPFNSVNVPRGKSGDDKEDEGGEGDAGEGDNRPGNRTGNRPGGGAQDPGEPVITLPPGLFGGGDNGGSDGGGGDSNGVSTGGTGGNGGWGGGTGGDTTGGNGGGDGGGWNNGGGDGGPGWPAPR